MATAPGDAGPRDAGRPTPRDGSLRGALAGVTADTQRLFRQEIELAKAEARQEAASAALAAGLFGGAGFAACMVAVLGSLAGAFGLAHVMDAAFAALVVAGAWLVIGAALFAAGRARARALSARPPGTRTGETREEETP
ncbi:phage holin family protein [Streptomyces sp. PT12]|uniref:phage holin family protein n=1 Tax=Streptomyces sp. PT12 TaxID=1510197 RepID=UPI000DE3F58A|nr:phage holin family protein [Streptomyces sp. PT12]RBM07298.1 hypothetical protein DEH69_24925 [Streptomyces sp. PT12]